MLRQRAYIPDCDWYVDVLYDVHPHDAEHVIGMLYDMGCSDYDIPKARRLLTNSAYNEGLTFSNRRQRRSLIAIEHTTDIFEVFNSLSHEKKHLEQDICKADGYDPYGENIAYISGAISEALARNAWRTMKKLFLYLI